MICDHASQIHIRAFGKSPPKIIPFGKPDIETVSTAAGFGGHRYWFLCPDCSRRCAILYFSRNGPPYACRLCRKGRYLTELQSPRHRRLTKALQLRDRLGQKYGGLLVLFPRKPKWMRWNRYLKLRTKAMALEREIWRSAAEELA